MNNYHIRIGKKLSYYLRHGLEKHNIPHDSEGFVDLNLMVPSLLLKL